MSETHDSKPRPKNRKRWRRWLGRTAVLLVILLAVSVGVFGILAQDHIRSLWSFRRVPNTNMYVMDYYGSYIIRGLYQDGVDLQDIPGSLIRNFFPRPQTSREPATKFAHLRKKMEKARIMSKIGKKK